MTSIGDQTTIKNVRSVSGGTINQAYYVETKKQRYFCKLNQGIEQNFFLQELKGLQLIQRTNTIRTPAVFGTWYDPTSQQGALILEWIDNDPTSDLVKAEEQLGKKLAQFHASYGQAFGLAEDNYLGYLPQYNRWSQDWALFYRDQRIRPQVDIGQKKGTIRGKRLQRLQNLIGKLTTMLNHKPKPSPLHGDLWSGNWLLGPRGEPYLIDPAAYYGDREIDIAFSECFGGFSPAFYEGYESVLPLSPDYPERRPLYQLLFLLVHLNLFGESYGSRVDQILDRYV